MESVVVLALTCHVPRHLGLSRWSTTYSPVYAPPPSLISGRKSADSSWSSARVRPLKESNVTRAVKWAIPPAIVAREAAIENDFPFANVRSYGTLHDEVSAVVGADVDGVAE